MGQAQDDKWFFKDPHPILSDSATYYVAIREGRRKMKVADSLKHRVPRDFLHNEPKWNPTSRSVDVRPTGDPELALIPQFKSLSGVPLGPQWTASVFVAACMLCAAV